MLFASRCSSVFESTLSPLDTSSYAISIRECGASKTITEGKRLHAELLERGYLGRYLANHLIQMYGKCGCLEEARGVFDWIKNRNLFTWTMMLAAYAHNSNFGLALQLYRCMDCEGIKPDSVTFLIIVNACSSSGSVRDYKQLFTRLVQDGSAFSMDVSLGNSIISMSGSFCRVTDARYAFDKMVSRDVVTWTAMITAYATSGHFVEALKLFREMELEGTRPDSIVFLALLDACMGQESKALSIVEMIHERVTVSAMAPDVMLVNAVINVYGSCTECHRARAVFDRMERKTTVSWNTMIAAYADNGCMSDALSLYQDMLAEDGAAPNEITVVTVLDVCSNLLCLKEGRQVHQKVIELGLEDNLFVDNALVDMYGKCGSLEEATGVFDKMKRKDIVSWTSLSVSYVRNGDNTRGLETYHGVHVEGLRPDQVTYVAALEACGNLGALYQGKSIHRLVSETKLEQTHEELATAVINMYVKCGRLEQARLVSEEVKSLLHFPGYWNTQMIGLAEHGNTGEAIQFFREMNLEGVEANDVSFVSAIFACSHAGLVKEGMSLFSLMVSDFGLRPRASHYVCVVELMSRVGELDLAVELVKSIPCQTGVFPWMVLLGSSSADFELGVMAAKEVIGAAMTRGGAYVLLSNLCAVDGTSQL